MAERRAALIAQAGEPNQGVVACRSQLNFYSGWAAAIGLLVLVLALDPAAVYSKPVADFTLSPQDAAFAAISLGAYHVFSHPRLELRSASLRIVGVFHDIEAPYAAVMKIDPDSDTYLRIEIDRRSRLVMGLERPKYEVVRNSEGVAHDAALLLSRRVEAATGPTGPVVRSVTRPDGAWWALLAIWCTYFGLGVLLSV